VLTGARESIQYGHTVDQYAIYMPCYVTTSTACPLLTTAAAALTFLLYSPPLDLFQDRHNNRHANRCKKRRVDRVFVCVRLPNHLHQLGLYGGVGFTKYNSPTIFGSQKARSANALGCFVRVNTSVSLCVEASEASSNNRTAKSTS
jgi:hypothetical protein